MLPGGKEDLDHETLTMRQEIQVTTGRKVPERPEKRISSPWNTTVPGQAPAAWLQKPQTRQRLARWVGLANHGTKGIDRHASFPRRWQPRGKEREMEKTFQAARRKNRGREVVSENQALRLQLANQSGRQPYPKAICSWHLITQYCVIWVIRQEKEMSPGLKRK